jgi:endonuclease III
VNAAKRRAIYERLRELNPHPATELEYATPFELLVAVVLSAQATDRSVNAATRTLFRRANTPAAFVALGEEKLSEAIRTIGLYRTKARNLIRLSEILLEQHDGDVPPDRAALEALPGVGRKTANVVLNAAFGEPTIAVDTHIFRVANRTRLAVGATVSEVEQRLLKVTPEEFRKDAHHWLILHGRYVCKARRPECWRCPIARWCEFVPKTPDPTAQPRTAR